MEFSFDLLKFILSYFIRITMARRTCRELLFCVLIDMFDQEQCVKTQQFILFISQDNALTTVILIIRECE
jgi:hypothetical protein